MVNYGYVASATSRAALRRASAVVFGVLVASSLLGAVPAGADPSMCGREITQSTTLTSDVGPCPADGLIVTAPNVTLDLNGFRVFAANGEGDNAGIVLRPPPSPPSVERSPSEEHFGVTVRNGTVSGFDAGVVVDGAMNRIHALTVRDNINEFHLAPTGTTPTCDLGDGILVLGKGNSIENNRVIHNGPYGGITLLGIHADDNVIKSNGVMDNNVVVPPGRTGCGNRFQDEGIRLEGPGAEGNRIERNLVVSSLLSGIGLHGYVCKPGPSDPPTPEPPNKNNSLIGNRISHTAGTSIAAGINILRQGPASIVCPAFGNTIVGNTSSNNQADGIFVSSDSRGNTINRNAVHDNGLDGIFLQGPNYSNRFTNVGPTLFDVVSPDLPPYVEGTDYRVMSGSGSGDVSARLVAIDIAIPPTATRTNNPNPPDTSTSGCEAADYAAAGFRPGDIALLQRGTCTFVSKVALAVSQGASAVVMFNEGQVPGRTTAAFGSVGPQDRPVLSAHYSIGYDLWQLTQASEVNAHIVTNTTNQLVFVAPGANRTTLVDNRASGNGLLDAEDENLDCRQAPEEADAWVNDWFRNWLGSASQACVARGGTGWGTGPGRSGDAPGRLEGRGQANNRGVDERYPSVATA